MQTLSISPWTLEFPELEKSLIIHRPSIKVRVLIDRTEVDFLFDGTGLNFLRHDIAKSGILNYQQTSDWLRLLSKAQQEAIYNAFQVWTNSPEKAESIPSMKCKDTRMTIISSTTINAWDKDINSTHMRLKKDYVSKTREWPRCKESGIEHQIEYESFKGSLEVVASVYCKHCWSR